MGTPTIQLNWQNDPISPAEWLALTLPERLRRSGIPAKYRRRIESWSLERPNDPPFVTVTTLDGTLLKCLPQDLRGQIRRSATNLVAAILESHQDPKHLIFVGDTGRGKSHLANSILFELCEGGRNVHRVECGDLFHEIKESYSSNGNGLSRAELLEPFEDAEVVLLDELTPARGATLSDHDIDILRLILNLCESKDLIVTTNLFRSTGNPTMSAWLDDRTVESRLYAGAHVWELFNALPDDRA